MTVADTVSAPLDELGDMIAIFRFEHLGDFLGVCQVEHDVGKFWRELSTPGEPIFTALAGRTGVFGVETSQRGERGLPFVDAVGELTQLLLHPFDFFFTDLGLLRDNLHFHLGGNKRNTILRQAAEIVAHLCRSQLNVADNLALHGAHSLTVAHIVAHHFPDLRVCHVVVLLHLFAGANLVLQPGQTGFHLLQHLLIAHNHTVQFSLMQEEFLHGQFFRNDTIGVAAETTVLVLGVEPFILHIRLQDGLIAHYPYHFVDDIVLRTGTEAKGTQQHTQKYFHNVLFLHLQ